MKIRIEMVEPDEEEIVIRTSELDDRVKRIQKAVSDITSQNITIVLYKGETQYFIDVNKLLFFETEDGCISAHTASDIFETRYKLYELEELLPGSFMRLSKSTILNTRHVYSITRNLTASSRVEFAGSHKQVYVSRNYYKLLVEKLNEKRLK